MFIMKKKLLKFGTTLAIAAMFGSASAQTLTLDLQAYPKDTVTGGYWSGTLNDDSTAIKFGEFVFSHSSQWGGMYWEGSTYATNGDLRQYGVPCPTQPCDSVHGGSIGWVSKQWGVMAGGGIKTIANNSVTEVEKGIPYLVSYWGYFNNETYEYDMNNQSVKVSLEDGSTFSPQEIYICNHPWSYYGNRDGDGFARPFQCGDYFILKINALDAGGGFIGTIIDTLAVYDCVNDTLIQNPDWHRIPFPRWNEVKTLYFTMESTDADPMFGPNTAVYFCMDKLKVKKSGNAPNSKSALQKVQNNARVTPQAVEVANYFPKTSYTGGTVVVYNAEGKEVLNMTVEAGEKINLSMLPAGEYRIQHGSKIIPFSKK